MTQEDLSHISDIDLFDPPDDIIPVNEFVDNAKFALDYFAKNMEHLKNFNGKKLTMFEWYFYFGRWNNSLKFLPEIEKRLEAKFSASGR